MSTLAAISWPAFLLLGAGHGVNPGMGWLFAVALGLQEKEGRAVWRALPPLALGHALSVGVVVAVAAVVGLIVPPALLRWLVATVLVVFGVSRLVRMRHPRYGGMRAGARQLTVWSFLMATAHGAGLMVVPFLLTEPETTTAQATTPIHAPDLHHAHLAVADAGAPSAHARHGAAAGATTAAHEGHAAHLASALGGDAGTPLAGLLATAVHTLGYLFVTGLVALLVYRRFGVRILRTAWINIDLIWAGSLIATGVLTLLLT